MSLGVADPIIAVKCFECDNVGRTEYKHRHKTVCKNCFEKDSIVVTMSPILKPHDKEAVAFLREQYVTWEEFEKEIEEE